MSDPASNDPDPGPIDRGEEAKRERTIATDERLERNLLRRRLFHWAGIAAVVYLVVLPFAIFYYLSSGSIAILATDGGWKALGAVDAAFAAMTFIPLSIFWTLAKITSPPGDTKKSDPSDGEALAKSIYDACSSFKDVVVSIRDAVKK